MNRVAFSRCTWAVKPPNPRVADSRSPVPAREGGAPCWCVRSLRSGSWAVSGLHRETISGRHRPQAVASFAGRSARAQVSLSQSDGRRSRRAPARTPFTPARSSLTPRRYHSPQATPMPTFRRNGARCRRTPCTQQVGLPGLWLSEPRGCNYAERKRAGPGQRQGSEAARILPSGAAWRARDLHSPRGADRLSR